MTRQTILATTLGALVLCTGLSGGASAKTMYFKSNHSHGVGYGGVVLGGLALGALAAGAAAAADGDCYLESRRVVDEFGNVYFRRVRVCE
jgi:hypothetical protein